MLHIISTFVLVLIALGIYYRKNKRWHMRYMISAFVVDVLLVLYIEITRQAVDQAITTLSFLLRFHITASVLTLVAYIVQFVLGFALINTGKNLRMAHITVGISFVVLRLTNYITSYMI
ncbi:MAG: hypothetical protein AAF984_07370 [Verrucomicrobiota bacterium]